MSKPQPTCPTCNKHDEVRSLYFMGVQPDGYVCQRCSQWFHLTADGPKALAHVISAGDDK